MWRNVQVWRPRRSTSGGQSEGRVAGAAVVTAMAAPAAAVAPALGIFLCAPVQALNPVQTCERKR